jgi:vacuolar iron transporter family protein
MDNMKPASGLGHYLRDVIYGATDGVITTFAIVSAASGAMINPHLVLILGLASLVADGVSMGASNYLGLKSEIQQVGGSVEEEAPERHGMATFAAFVAAGSVPLLPYLYLGPLEYRFAISVTLAIIVFTLMGTVRAAFTNQSRFRSAAEIVILGTAAGSFAFGVGRAGAYFLEVSGLQGPPF